LKRIYESSRGFLEVESFKTFDSHEIWLTFFDEEGWPRQRLAAQMTVDLQEHP
jgi:hypothetical protein